MWPPGLGKIIITVFVVPASDFEIDNPVGEQCETIVDSVLLSVNLMVCES